MSCTIIPDHDLKIIRYRHSGMIKDEDIHTVWMKLLTMPVFTAMGYNLLSDYRDSRFDIAIDKVDTIVEFMMSIKPVIEGKKQSLIVDNPYNTAASVRFSDRVIEKTGFLVNVFSSETVALAWLLKR